MKLGHRVEDLEKQLLSLELRVATTGLKISDVPKKIRGFFAEHVVAAELHNYGIRCEMRHVCSKCKHENMPKNTDLVAYRPFTKNPARIPVQVKSISLWKHGYLVDIEDTPFKEFKGFYIILIEHEPEDFFLYVEHTEMQKLMYEQNPDGPQRRGKTRPHNYWTLKIPQDLQGFLQYLERDKFVEAVLETKA